MSDAGDLFDQYAAAYEQALESAVAPSGENREYFARGRVAWLARCLSEAKVAPRTVLDFGCGDGATTPLLVNALRADAAVGVDVSAKALEIARKNYGAPAAGDARGEARAENNGGKLLAEDARDKPLAQNARDKAQIAYKSVEEFRAGLRQTAQDATPDRAGRGREGEFDLAYCNGVFHHIAPGQRLEALALVHGALRAGGLFSFWENNPWSPATRYVMSRCAFDRDAILLSSPEARALLRRGGFQILRTDFRFIFPRALRALRPVEDAVYRLPLGAQYQVLCRAERVTGEQ
jgi:SAM-dependent methyltransferase